MNTIKRIAVIAGISLGGLAVAGTAGAAADGTNQSTCGFAGYENNPGYDISQVAGEFNPGNVDDGGPFVAFYCNPTNRN